MSEPCRECQVETGDNEVCGKPARQAYVIRPVGVRLRAPLCDYHAALFQEVESEERRPRSLMGLLFGEG